MKKLSFAFAAVAALVCLFSLSGCGQKETVWDNPTIEYGSENGDGYFNIAIDVTRVELEDSVTNVFLTLHQRSDYGQFRFCKETYLLAGGKRYPLVSVEGIELDSWCHTEDGKCEMVFHFQPLPRETKVFDFLEGDGEGAFKVCGIRPVEERHKMLFPSYWRNGKTGNWDIAFLEDCAVYDCKIWDLQADVDSETGEAEMVLSRNGEKVNVHVGKNRKGKRTMRIDGKKGVYSMITDRFLPDYPKKDTRSDFVDTDYRVDTATVVGWIKDMPEKYRSDKFFDFGTADFLTDKEIFFHAEMDSLGRFSIRIPLLNSTGFFFDWKRCFMETVLEPGKTYFLLYDFKEGRRMWMGDDARLQNELFKYPLDWESIRIEDEDGEDFNQFVASVDSFLQAQYARVDEFSHQHPTASTRFNLYRKGNTLSRQAFHFGQARFHTKDRHLPENARQFAYDHIFSKMPKPYTLHREMSTFLRDYVSDVSSASAPQSVTFNVFDHVEEIASSQEELEWLKAYKAKLDALEKALSAASDEKEKQRIAADFNTRNEKDIKLLIDDIYQRPLVQQMIQANLYLPTFKNELHVLDSLGADQSLKDIWITRQGMKAFEQTHSPLSPQTMDSLKAWISNASMWEVINQKNNYYIALENNKLDDVDLHTGEEVAGMSEGKEILEKILKPYKGKVVLIDVWGTWCGPCKQALSHSEEEYERLKKYDIQYVYLANNSPKDSWENIIKEYNVKGSNVSHFNLPEGQQSAIERYLQVSSFPTYKLVDKQGHVLDIKVDARQLDDLEKDIKLLFDK